MSLEDLLPDRARGFWTGAVVAVATAVVATAVIAPFRQEFGRLDTGLCFLFFTALIASAWGIRVGLVSAVANYLCLNYFFIPPLHRLVVRDPKNVGSWILETSVFAATAVVVGRRPAVRDRDEPSR